MKLYSKKQVADLWGCSVAFIEKEIHNGKLTFTRIGSMVRFREEDLETYVGKNVGTTCTKVPPHTRKPENAPTENKGTYGLVRGGK